MYTMLWRIIAYIVFLFHETTLHRLECPRSSETYIAKFRLKFNESFFMCIDIEFTDVIPFPKTENLLLNVVLKIKSADNVQEKDTHSV